MCKSKVSAACKASRVAETKPKRQASLHPDLTSLPGAARILQRCGSDMFARSISVCPSCYSKRTYY